MAGFQAPRAGRFSAPHDKLAANSSKDIGSAKRGTALLAGLLRCRRCGRKLTVHYTGRDHDVLRYSCLRGWMDQGEPRCAAFGGVPVDEAIGDQVLRVVAPAGVEAAVLASMQQQQQVDEVHAALRRDLEARLAEQTQSAPKSASFDDFADLAADLDAVWRSPAAEASLKKRIVRTLIEEVVADCDSQANEILLTIHWKGGVHTELRLPRRRRGQMNHTAAPPPPPATPTPLGRVWGLGARLRRKIFSSAIIRPYIPRNCQNLVRSRKTRH